MAFVVLAGIGGASTGEASLWGKLSSATKKICEHADYLIDKGETLTAKKYGTKKAKDTADGLRLIKKYSC